MSGCVYKRPHRPNLDHSLAPDMHPWQGSLHDCKPHEVLSMLSHALQCRPR